MTDQLTDHERTLAEIAVAAAPTLTEEQIARLRRALKPSLNAPVMRLPRARGERRNAA